MAISRTKRVLRSLWLATQYFVLMTLSLSATTFIMINGYELAFTKEVPFAIALTPVPVRDIIDRNTSPQIVKDPNSGEGNFGHPLYLKLTPTSTRLQVVPAIYQNGHYLARQSTAQFAYLSPAKGGNIGNTLVYLREGWRTINDPSTLTVGDNVFLDTDRDWRYMFRISNTQLLPATTSFILPDTTTPDLLLAITSSDNKSIQYVTATFVNLQNTQL
ncbi:MAG: hypothetical protein WCO52_01995 [bacterium]